MINEAFIEKKSREALERIRNAVSNIDVSGTVYYVSNNGNDANDGKTPEKALQSLNAVNALSLKSGDAVLFKRGDVFRGYVKLREGVTFSSYGTGAKPRIYGADENAAELEWKNEGNNIYSIPIDHKQDIGCIVFNEGEEWGYKKWLPGQTELLMDLDFYHDIENHKLYLYSDSGNPSQRWSDIEVCRRRHIMSGKADNCTVDGLVLKYGGAHGISLGSVDYPENEKPVYRNIYNMTVRNCEFEWIGGSIQFSTVRFGNGLEIWGGCTGHTVENCYFNQIYDAAVTQQYNGSCRCTDDMPLEVRDTVMRDNLIERSTYSYEYFITENEGGKCVVDSKWKFVDTYFENNICRLAGYGWGNQRPDRSTAAHIKSWGHFNNSENFVIRNNIFDRSDYRLVQVLSHFDSCQPILDSNIYCQYVGKIIVQNNFVTSVMDESIAKDYSTAADAKNPVDVTGDSKGILVAATR